MQGYYYHTGMKFITILLLIISFTATAQQDPDYPQHYFRNPLNIPIALAGGFAECRPNHFHTGIDIKTNQKENLPVYAAADGYVSRITVSHSGYGNAIYISHPNGYTTLYGHLNDFYPALQQYLKQKQYEQESWSADINIPANRFAVKKGQLIAYSGTTGGSTGPHLHFEIRSNTTEHVLNAMLFGLPISDSRAPEAKSIAVYNATQSIYEQQPAFLPLLKKEGGYTTKTPVYTSNSPKVYIGIQAQDYLNNSTNWLGVYRMKLFLDEALQAATELREIDFAQNRYVNAYADFKTKEEKGVWYQSLYRLPGNELDVYTHLNAANGALDISNGQPHDIRIELEDANGNVSQVKFAIRYTGKAAGNACGNIWQPGKVNTLQTGNISFAPDRKALYDKLCFKYTESPSKQYYSNVVQLHDAKIPLHSTTDLGIKINQPLPFDLRSKLVFIHHIRAASLPGNNPQDGAAARYDKGWAWAPIRTFGNYYVSIDTIPPVLTAMQKGSDFRKLNKIQFKVTDKMTSVKQFRAELDGKWLCFVRAGNVYSYTFDERCSPGQHKLVVKTSDENDNQTVYSLNFQR